MDVVGATYKLTRRLPVEERYGLSSQARRAAVSIPANIAEGRTQHTVGGYIRHLGIATGSLAELETHLLITVRLGMLQEADVKELLEITGRLGRMLNVLARRLKSRSNRMVQSVPGSHRSPTPNTRHPSA